MTKRKKQWPTLEQKLERPWCYYCDREFDDLKILISHQKAKHFKCERCSRRLNTAGGLAVHMTQVHKETLHTVENAMPGRQSLDIEIFGMEGVPRELIDNHNYNVQQQHWAEAQERARRTGNPIQGLPEADRPLSKRNKPESDENMLRTLELFKKSKTLGSLPLAEIGQRAVASQNTPSSQPPVSALSVSFSASQSPAAFAHTFEVAPSLSFDNFAGVPQLLPTQALPPVSLGLQVSGISGHPPRLVAPSQFAANASVTSPISFHIPPGVASGSQAEAGSLPGQNLPHRPTAGTSSTTYMKPELMGQVPLVSNAAIAASVDELISDAKEAGTGLEGFHASEKKGKKEKNALFIGRANDNDPEETLGGQPATTPASRGNKVALGAA